MKGDYELIKRDYGENFAKLCRKLFPRILETEGLLYKILKEHFAPNHSLFKDIILNSKKEKFQDYIIGCLNQDKPLFDSGKTVKELLEKRGYDFYICKTQEDILKFKKYYERDEELCTFREHRLNTCHVFFAVKKDVDRIKREN